MAVTGSVDRRIKCLQIASTQLRRQGKEEAAPPAEELVNYAKVLSSYALHGEGQGGMKS